MLGGRPLPRTSSANQALMAAVLHQAHLEDGHFVQTPRERSAAPPPTVAVRAPQGGSIRGSVLSRMRSSPTLARHASASALLRRALKGAGHSKRADKAPRVPHAPPLGAASSPPPTPGADLSPGGKDCGGE